MNVIKDEYINNLPKSQVFVAHSFWVICPNVSRTFVELCIVTPYWCTVLVGTNMASGNQQKHPKFTFSIKARSFHSRTSIHAHITYLKWLYCWKSRGETIFQRDSIPTLVLRRLWKLGSSNCCTFEMKHATGMETCARIYFLVIFNRV